jgi:transketolase
LPKKVAARVAVEAGVGMGWERYVGAGGKVISVERFGASAPYKIIYENLGLTVENIVAQAKSVMPKKIAKPKSKSKKIVKRK